jgi:glycine cleavage system transcriptional repressor
LLRRCLGSGAKTSNPVPMVINAVGRDRVGIVSDVSGMVIGVGGNVGDSQAAKLGPYFSLMMLVTVPDSGDAAQKLRTSLTQLHDMNATLFHATDIVSPETSASFTPQIGYKGTFTLEGADHPGIVHKVTSSIAKHGLSIDSLHTSQEIAPYGGTMLFTMRGTATAAAPLAKSFDISVIKQDLVALGNSLNCDVALDDLHEDKDSASFYAG